MTVLRDIKRGLMLDEIAARGFAEIQSEFGG
jgi:hypothetical protein